MGWRGEGGGSQIIVSSDLLQLAPLAKMCIFGTIEPAVAPYTYSLVQFNLDDGIINNSIIILISSLSFLISSFGVITLSPSS